MRFYAVKLMPYCVHEENKMLLKRLDAYSKKNKGNQDDDNDYRMM
jgi:hypothetical protein